MQRRGLPPRIAEGGGPARTWTWNPEIRSLLP